MAIIRRKTTESEDFYTLRNLVEQIRQNEAIKNKADTRIQGFSAAAKCFLDILTFKELILVLLLDGIPRTNAKLLWQYNHYFGDKMSNTDFSVRMSQLVKSDIIKKHLTNEIDKTYYWGKSSWFEGDKLKEEYLTKIDSMK